MKHLVLVPGLALAAAFIAAVLLGILYLAQSAAHLEFYTVSKLEWAFARFVLTDAFFSGALIGVIAALQSYTAKGGK